MNELKSANDTIQYNIILGCSSFTPSRRASGQVPGLYWVGIHALSTRVVIQYQDVN